MFEISDFMNRCGNKFFVYFAQEERNQMLRPQLVDVVLTRKMQYTCVCEKRDACCHVSR